MRRARSRTAIHRTVLTALLALVMALRVAAQPAVLTAPDPGVIALCSGGQIVYVSLETGLPVPGEDSAPKADPCPFFGVTAFDLATAPAAPAPAPARATPRPYPAEAALADGPRRGLHGARAPPA